MAGEQVDLHRSWVSHHSPVPQKRCQDVKRPCFMSRDDQDAQRVQSAIPPQVGVHRCSCGYPPSPRGGPALWETLKVATFAIPQSHSVDCKAERVRPGRCGNDTPIVPSASWRRSKTVTRNGRRTSPRRRGTSRLTAGTSGVRCCASKTPVGISRLYLCAARRHTPEL